MSSSIFPLCSRTISDFLVILYPFQAAYDILSSPDRRKQYDRLGIDLGEDRIESQLWQAGCNVGKSSVVFGKIHCSRIILVRAILIIVTNVP